MADKVKVGECACPVCKAPDAEVIETNTPTKFVYLKCSECVSIIRTSSRAGDRALRAMVATPEREPDPAPPEPPKKKKVSSVFLDLGGDDA